jgi:hypothetical protein
MFNLIPEFRLDDILTEHSLNNNSLIPKTIIEYPSIRTEYTTDKEDYTLTESLAFSIRTNQQISQTVTILAGFTSENINYTFNIKVCVELNMKTKVFF